MLLTADNVRYAIGARTLFDGLSLRLDKGERVGLIGDNGTGKTTLLRVIEKEVEPDDGNVFTARGASVGYLKQDPDFDPDNTAIDEAESAFAELHNLAHELRDLEHKMADSGGDLDRVMKEYARVGHAFEEAGGYAWRHKLEAALTGVGLDRALWETNVGKLSGGQRSRLQLAKLLVNAPDVLLLDEPTNHLDLKAIEWLEGELGRFAGAVLVVSHDRFLLDRLATRIDWLTGGRLKSYPGNYAAFVKQRELEELSQQRAYDKQQRDVEKQAEFVRRFKAGQRAREAKGREKRLNRLLESDAMVAAVERRGGGMKLSFDTAPSAVENVLRVEELSKSYGPLELWNGIKFGLKRGDRLGIVGPNGCGKTTLLRCLVGEATADSGNVRWGHNLAVGYYDQRLEDFDPEATVMDELYGVAHERGLKEPQLRTILGTMRFGGDDVYKTMSALSGGERARVALTKLLLEQANVLVLDEPTNHLDVASREALEGALKSFDGTIVAVSHDRYFLTNVTDRLLIFTGQKVVDFGGTWRDWLNEQQPAATPAKASQVPKAKPKPSNGQASERSKNKYLRPFGGLSVKDLENRITDAEVELAGLQDLFGDAGRMSDPKEAKRLTTEVDQKAKELAQLEEEYFSRDA